jgi:hypothetical protein
VLPGTHLSDPLNGRKQTEWGRNGTRVFEDEVGHSGAKQLFSGMVIW